MAAAPITVTYNNVSGTERVMHLRHLGHREFFETLHLAIGIAAGALEGDVSKFSLLSVLRALDFKTFAAVATTLLKGSVLEGVGQIEDPFGMQYFRDHPDELYIASYNALIALHPDLYSKIKAEMAQKNAAVSARPNAVEEGDE